MNHIYELREGMHLYLVVDFDIYEGVLLREENGHYFVFHTDKYDDPMLLTHGEGNGYFYPIAAGASLTKDGIISGKHKIFPTSESAEHEVGIRKFVVMQKYESDETLMVNLFESWAKDPKNILYVDIVRDIIQEKFCINLQ